jgi:hypothetical protein
MGVDADHGVDKVCQQGHGLVLFNRERVEESAPAWMGFTERHICDESRHRRTGF